MRSNQQRGFTAVEALLIIIVIALIGLAGWYVYNAKKPANANYAAKSSQSQTSSNAKQSSMAESKVGDFDFMYSASWTVASNVRPDEALTIKSPDEQTDSKGTVTAGATVDVYSKTINSAWFGNSLSEYMKNYGSEKPTTTTVAGYSALKIETGGVVAVAFTKDNTVYGVEEYYASGSTNPYPTVVDDIAASFKLSN